MTRTQYFVAASLDGFIADAEGRLDWLYRVGEGSDVSAHYESFLSGVGALAMGAATYEFLLAEGVSWPYGALPTWVFTHRELPTLPKADIRFTSEDVKEVHRRLCEAAQGKNVWLIGGGNLVAQFAERGLLDELWLSVAPVLLGSGSPVLPVRGLSDKPLELREITRFRGGIVELRYAVPQSTGRPSV